MKRAFAIGALVVGIFTILVIPLYAPLKNLLWTHPWWHSTLLAVPTIALALFAFLELRHSAEANTHRAEANRYRDEANAFRAEANEHLSEANAHRDEANNLRRQVADLQEERNQHLQQIADNTRKPISQAEKNAAVLRKHRRAKVRVSEGQSYWGDAPEIVEVSDDNLVTLFTAHSTLTSNAWCVQVNCGELEITAIPDGSFPLRIKVLKRYGSAVSLGEITKWEDHLQAASATTFSTGSFVYQATYVKPGTPEMPILTVFASKDGGNLFLLKTSGGETHTGDNLTISKRFVVLQCDLRAAGYKPSGSHTGISPFPLFID